MKTSDDFDKTEAALLGLALALKPIAIAVEGLVVMLLWNWFVPEIGGPTVGYFPALGISLLFAWLSYDPFKALNDRDTMDLLKVELHWFLAALFVTGIGYLVHLGV